VEDLGLQPDQLMACSVADDLGPDGKLRRTRGDLFLLRCGHRRNLPRSDDKRGEEGGQAGQGARMSS